MCYHWPCLLFHPRTAESTVSAVRLTPADLKDVIYKVNIRTVTVKLNREVNGVSRLPFVEDTLEQIRPKIELLERSLRDIAAMDHVGNARNRGMMAGIEVVKNKGSKEPYPWEDRIGWRVCNYAREHGVFIRPLGNVIVIMPPLAISTDNLQQLMKVIKEGIATVTSGG